MFFPEPLDSASGTFLLFFQVARRLVHRPMLVYRIPRLVVIDGIPVSEEERTKAELYFVEQQVSLDMSL